MELGDHVVVRILGLEVGVGVFFVVSVGRVAVEVGLVVIVVDSVVAGDAVGAEVTLSPRLCYKTSNYFLLSPYVFFLPSRARLNAARIASSRFRILFESSHVE